MIRIDLTGTRTKVWYNDLFVFIYGSNQNVTTTTDLTEYTEQFVLPEDMVPSQDLIIKCTVLNSAWYPLISTTAIVTIKADRSVNSITTRINGKITSGVIQFHAMFPRDYFIFS